MRDVSFQGATLTLYGPGNISQVTIRDLSDEGTPISFGGIQPIRTSKTMHGIMLAWHAQTTPEFTLSPIPNSKSDNLLRALLLSSTVKSTSEMTELSEIALEKAVLTIPGHKGAGNGESTSANTYTFTTGFLVDGTSAIGATQEGRQVTGPYRFVWEDSDVPKV